MLSMFKHNLITLDCYLLDHVFFLLKNNLTQIEQDLITIVIKLF